MSKWLSSIPVLDNFSQVADAGNYAPLPDDWLLGISDVVGSTAAIEAGQYKAVNLAGAATISAVSNALEGDPPLFVFGGDGAHFALSQDQAPLATSALARVASWSERDLGLKLRVGMASVADIRAAGQDVRVAFWQASKDVRYPMFTGGGLEWAEKQLKAGAIDLGIDDTDEEPDLTGLSCQWGPVQSKHGSIVSLIVRKAPNASEADFYKLCVSVIETLDEAGSANPVSEEGPDVHWPSEAIALQSRIANMKNPNWIRWLKVVKDATIAWAIFKTGVRIGRFDPNRYRREMAANTDFRKFNDALLMTVDCAPNTIQRLSELLGEAKRLGVAHFGMHLQEEALMTCVVPSILSSYHMHFVDGSGGGYAAAARQLND